jgi:molybdopterin converting factor small subunit
MADSIKIKIIYFAGLREVVELDEEIIVLPKGALPSDAQKLLNEKYDLNIDTNLKVAINDQFSDWDKELSNGDRLVFIPPVTGG